MQRLNRVIAGTGCLIAVLVCGEAWPASIGLTRSDFEALQALGRGRNPAPAVQPTQATPASGDVPKPGWLGRFFYKKDGESYVCTAFLIAPRVILMPAHCVRDPETGALYENMVFAVKEDAAASYRAFQIECVATRPEWVQPGLERFFFDYATALLDRDPQTGHFGVHWSWDGQYNRAIVFRGFGEGILGKIGIVGGLAALRPGASMPELLDFRRLSLDRLGHGVFRVRAHSHHRLQRVRVRGPAPYRLRPLPRYRFQGALGLHRERLPIEPSGRIRDCSAPRVIPCGRNYAYSPSSRTAGPMCKLDRDAPCWRLAGGHPSRVEIHRTHSDGGVPGWNPRRQSWRGRGRSAGEVWDSPDVSGGETADGKRAIFPEVDLIDVIAM